MDANRAAEIAQDFLDHKHVLSPEVFLAQKYLELERRLEVARGALRWYADPEHWTIPYVEGHLGDWGTRAREALARLGGE